MRPLLRYAALYAAVELAAVALLTWAIGLGWTLVVIAGSFMVGLLLAATQWKGQDGAIRRVRTNPHGVVADGVLVGLGSFLVFLPGLVSTMAGALMLTPPTRAAMRPLAATLLGRGVMRGVGAINLDQFANLDQFGDRVGRGGTVGRGDYIDGEVIGEPVHYRGATRTAIVRRAGV